MESTNERFENDDHSRFAAPDYSPDSLLYNKVSERLLNNPHVEAVRVLIQVEDGVVTLSGNLANAFSKQEAEKSLEGISEIKDIFNFIELDQFEEADGDGLVKK